jgi:DNA polymerase
VAAHLGALLEYLDEMGYGTLYLPPADASEPRAATPRAAASSLPASRAADGGGDPAGAPPAGTASADTAPADTAPADTAPADTAPADTARPGASHPEAQRKGAPAAAAADALNPHDSLFGVPPSGWERFANLQDLGGHVADCTRCRLAEGRRSVVFGSGNPNADLMFIGEGPGAEEDRQGLPFVGPAGALLTKMIEGIDRSRDDVYIANIVKCRPPGNRDPMPDEVAACRGYLERQVELVAPRVIVALGRVAAQTLLGNDLPLGRMRGSWYRFAGVDLRVTYHPAALLRNVALKRPTWDDMQVVRDRLRQGG